jgi:fumarate hydratase class II
MLPSISDRRFTRPFIRALGLLKRAAALETWAAEERDRVLVEFAE